MFAVPEKSCRFGRRDIPAEPAVKRRPIPDRYSGYYRSGEMLTDTEEAA